MRLANITEKNNKEIARYKPLKQSILLKFSLFLHVKQLLDP